MDEIFYHGGAEPDFTLDKLDVLRSSQKQQNKNDSYAGFYMYGSEDRDLAFKYAEQENNIKKTTTKGVEKIVLDSNLKIYDMPPFSITRITKDQIKDLQSQGYDLIRGKMMSKTEYVLINKNKIKSMEFIPIDMRYQKTEQDNGRLSEIKKEKANLLNEKKNLLLLKKQKTNAEINEGEKVKSLVNGGFVNIILCSILLIFIISIIVLIINK